MTLLDQLRSLPTTLDVVVGDFGREAATRYMSILAEEERRLLTHLLAPAGLPFFDEYRRIMFAHVGDVDFLKRESIHRVWETTGYLTDEVLVAVRAHDVPADMTSRFACLIRDEAVLARRRGHRRVRTVLPCNALSDVLQAAIRIAADVDASNEAARAIGYPIQWAKEPMPEIRPLGMVPSALAQLSRLSDVRASPYVVLGSQMARDQYIALGSQLGMTVLPLTTKQQSVVDDAVLLCIEGTAEGHARARAEIGEAVLKPLRADHPSLVVLEACTDFDFGIGLDSVRLMAQHAVAECYLDISNNKLRTPETGPTADRASS